ncbi:MAG TPA: glycosyltransferase [Cyclobacteriaceae bacterium]
MLNIHIYPSYLTNESRMLREARSLVDLKLVTTITLLGLWKKGLKQEEVVTNQISIRRLGSIAKSTKHKWLNLVAFAVFYLKAIWYCVRKKPRIVNAHSLTVLPLAAFVKWLTGARLIYDPHELETESNDSRGYRKKVAKRIEKMFIRSADFTIVVGHNIADWYRNTYTLHNIEVIRNIPLYRKTPSFPHITLRERLGLGHGKIVYVYLGALIPGRGIEIILDAFKAVGDPHHVVFVGFGEYESMVANFSREHDNIHCLPSVPPEEVVELSSGADVGISLIENTSLSYYYCLPNKVFEYLQAGVPFIASDFPELRKEFGNERFCWLIRPDRGSLIETIRSITPEDIMQRKTVAQERRDNWSWRSERQKYRSIYEQLA